MAAGVLVLVGVALLDGREELGELSLVLLTDLGEGEDGRGLVDSQRLDSKQTGSRTYLLVDNSTETSLALDDGVGDTHLAAQSRKENNQLNGVDVVGNQNKRSLLVLDEADNVVETVLDVVRLLADVLLLLALSNSGGLAVQTLLLLDLGLRAVLVEELEGLRGGVAVQGVLELGDRRRHLEAHVQDLLLALKTNILGPLDEAGQVATGLDVLADAEVTGALLDQGVLVPLAVYCTAEIH